MVNAGSGPSERSSGAAARYKRFADARMGEYDLEGWTVPDLINATDVSVIMKSFLQPQQ